MAEPKAYKTRLSDFKPDPHNLNRHKQRGRGMVENSQRKRGFGRPGFAARDKTMLGGNLSIMEVAADIDLGNGEIFVVETDGDIPIVHLRRDLDPDTEAAKLLAAEDNQSALVSIDFDPEVFAAEIAAGVDFGEVFTADEQAAMLAGLNDTPPDTGPQIDKAEELREKWGVELGQLWVLGEHRLICGNCTDGAVVERVMGGERAQMIFTDPPYGVDYTGGAKERNRLNNDNIGTNIYKNALPIFALNTDDKAPLYLWYADGHAAAAAASASAAGYQIVAQIIWAKNHAQFVTSAHYKGKHEPCYYGHKKGKPARWYGPNNEVTLWEYDRSPSNDYHPTQKPVPIAERAIKNSSQAGDIVFDGFLGGGTTLIAAQNLNRRCRGIELDPAYCAVILERFQSTFGIEPELIEQVNT